MRRLTLISRLIRGLCHDDTRNYPMSSSAGDLWSSVMSEHSSWQMVDADSKHSTRAAAATPQQLSAAAQRAVMPPAAVGSKRGAASDASDEEGARATPKPKPKRSKRWVSHHLETTGEAWKDSYYKGTAEREEEAFEPARAEQKVQKKKARKRKVQRMTMPTTRMPPAGRVLRCVDCDVASNITITPFIKCRGHRCAAAVHVECMKIHTRSAGGIGHWTCSHACRTTAPACACMDCDPQTCHVCQFAATAPGNKMLLCSGDNERCPAAVHATCLASVTGAALADVVGNIATGDFFCGDAFAGASRAVLPGGCTAEAEEVTQLSTPVRAVHVVAPVPSTPMPPRAAADSAGNSGSDEDFVPGTSESDSEADAHAAPAAARLQTPRVQTPRRRRRRSSDVDGRRRGFSRAVLQLAMGGEAGACLRAREQCAGCKRSPQTKQMVGPVITRKELFYSGVNSEAPTCDLCKCTLNCVSGNMVTSSDWGINCIPCGLPRCRDCFTESRCEITFNADGQPCPVNGLPYICETCRVEGTAMTMVDLVCYRPPKVTVKSADPAGCAYRCMHNKECPWARHPSQQTRNRKVRDLGPESSSIHKKDYTHNRPAHLPAPGNRAWVDAFWAQSGITEDRIFKCIMSGEDVLNNRQQLMEANPRMRHSGIAAATRAPMRGEAMVRAHQVWELIHASEVRFCAPHVTSAGNQVTPCGLAEAVMISRAGRTVPWRSFNLVDYKVTYEYEGPTALAGRAAGGDSDSSGMYDSSDSSDSDVYVRTGFVPPPTSSSCSSDSEEEEEEEEEHAEKPSPSASAIFWSRVGRSKAAVPEVEAEAPKAADPTWNKYKRLGTLETKGKEVSKLEDLVVRLQTSLQRMKATEPLYDLMVQSYMFGLSPRRDSPSHDMFGMQEEMVAADAYATNNTTTHETEMAALTLQLNTATDTLDGTRFELEQLEAEHAMQCREDGVD